MKIDRLIGILSVLLQEEKVTAPQLAEKFENITGADIKDIVYYAALIALQNNKEYVEMDDFSKAYGYVIKRYNTEERE